MDEADQDFATIAERLPTHGGNGGEGIGCLADQWWCARPANWPASESESIARNSLRAE